MNTSPMQDLEQQLRTHYQQEIGKPSSASDFWHKLEYHLPAQEHPQVWWKRWFRMFSLPGVMTSSAPRPVSGRHFVVAGPLLLGMSLLVFGIVYTAGMPGSLHRTTRTTQNTTIVSADTALLSQLLLSTSQANTSQLARSGQFTQIDQTQNIGSHTVSLQKVYADANNIIIGYTADVSRMASIPPGPVHSVVPLVPSFTITLSNGQTLREDGAQFKTVSGQKRIAVLSYFDASSIQGNPQQLQLSFSIMGAHFERTVPFHAGKTVQLNQKTFTNSAGYAITFDRVVITPSETRFFIKGMGEWAKLSIAGKIYQPELMSGSAIFPSGESYISYWKDLHNDTGTWTLQASSNIWHFTFVVS